MTSSDIVCWKCDVIAKANTLPKLTVHFLLPYHTDVHVNIYITFPIFTDVPPPTA